VKSTLLITLARRNVAKCKRGAVRRGHLLLMAAKLKKHYRGDEWRCLAWRQRNIVTEGAVEAAIGVALLIYLRLMNDALSKRREQHKSRRGLSARPEETAVSEQVEEPFLWAVSQVPSCGTFSLLAMTKSGISA